MACPEIKHILFATDESENAHHAFSYVECFARQFDAKVTLLHVVQEFRDMVVFDFGIERSVAAEKWFTVNNEYFQEIKKNFKDFVEQHYKQEVIDEVIVVKGNPVKQILLAAKDKKCDLIVMGSHGKGGLEDATLGNTVADVLRRSKIPVFVAPYSKKK